MNKLKLTVVAFLAMTMIVLGACAKDEAKETSKSSSQGTTSEMITVTDSDGKVEVPLKPKKIVVFDMGSLDTIDALGHGSEVVGTATDKLPSYLKQYKKVESAGGIKEPDLEKINQLKPDLIIISGRQADFKKDLSAIAPTIFLAVEGNDTWKATKTNIETIAKILGEEKLAGEKIAELDKKIAAVKEKATASGEKTLVTLVNEGQLAAYGIGSRFGIIHDTFGFPQADDKIKVSKHGESVSYEYILEKNPDLIFVIDRTKAVGGDSEKNNVASNELVAQTTAGKNKRVIALTPDLWYLSGGGLESTSLMLDEVSQALK